MVTVVNDLCRMGEVLHTGSRVVCNPPVLNTDDDYVLLTGNLDAAEARLERLGFERTSGEPYSEMPSVFSAWRHGIVNVILTGDGAFFRRFKIGTEVAQKLNLRDKTARIALFQAVLYGNREATGTEPDGDLGEEVPF